MCHERAGAETLATPESIEIFCEDAIAPRRQHCSIEIEQPQNCPRRLKRQRRRGFEFLEDDAGSNAIDAFYLHELVEQKPLQVLMGRHNDFQQIVDFTGQVIALEHFGQLPDSAGESLDAARAVVSEQNLDEAKQIESDGLAVHERGVALYHPELFELAHAFLEAGGRQVQPAGQLHAGGTRVALQVRQQSPVQIVERRSPGNGDSRLRPAAPYRHTHLLRTSCPASLADVKKRR